MHHTSARAALVAACRQVADAGLVPGTSGNASLRTPEGILVTPSGVPLASLVPDDVSLLTPDATTEGGATPTSELPLHLALYRRADVAAVVHTHAARAVAVTCIADELPPLHYQWLAFGGAVRVAPFHTFGTPELAEAVCAALQGRTAALMAHHGAVTVGGDLESAVSRTLLLDWACEVYLAAAAAAAPRTLSEAQLEGVAAAARRRGYPSLAT